MSIHFIRPMALLVFCLWAGLSQAGGFLQPNLSASAAGAANAFVASASDASAAIYNPSGAAWQEGVSLSLGGMVDFRTSSVATAGGKVKNNGDDPTAFYLYGSWMPLDGNLGVSFAIGSMYVIENDWTGLTGGPKASLDVYHTSVDAVYALNSSLAFSLGPDWYVTNGDLSQGGNSFSANDYTSFGGHASVLWKFMPTWSFGLMARSGANIDASDGNKQMDFRLPDSVTAGVAHDVADVWRIEADVQWTRWSTLKDMNVTSGGTTLISNPLDLRDTFTAMLGVTWTWQTDSQLRFGYAYDQGASKTQGFNPLVADQDGHRVSIGLGGEGFGAHFDIAYIYSFYPDMKAAGTYAGKYSDQRHSFVLSVSKGF